jgi:biotin carboxyl carrier protein
MTLNILVVKTRRWTCRVDQRARSHTKRSLRASVSLWFKVCSICPALAAPAALAHEGEDHGAPQAQVQQQPIGPRVEATSPDFELLAVLEGDQLTLYLDRYATNEPVPEAKIEVESGANRGVAKPAGPGVYTLPAPWLSAPGKHDLVFTIEAGETSDLLAASVEIQETASHNRAGLLARYAAWAAGTLPVLVVAGMALRWLRNRRRNALALAGLLLAATLAAPQAREAAAHEGEDHSQPAPNAAAPALSAGPSAAARPTRLADGSLFVPKPSQRVLGITTVLAQATSVPLTVQLTGQVVPEPDAGGRVQAPMAGRLEPGLHGLPRLGQRVRRGQVLGYIAPVASSIDRGNQQALLAELDSELAIEERKLDRYIQLEGSIPQKDIEAARLSVESLRQRRAAVSASLYTRVPLTAPVSGVVSAATVLAGQVVDLRDTLWEIVDPGRLAVEALAYDLSIKGRIASGTALTMHGHAYPLVHLGAAQQLRSHALPVLFRVADGRASLAVGEPVTVLAQLKQTVKGVPLPEQSVVKGATGGALVWVKNSAERFSAKPVEVQPLGAGRVAVVSGLDAGERVVVRGAPLLSQIR